MPTHKKRFIVSFAGWLELHEACPVLVTISLKRKARDWISCFLCRDKRGYDEQACCASSQLYTASLLCLSYYRLL